MKRSELFKALNGESNWNILNFWILFFLPNSQTLAWLTDWAKLSCKMSRIILTFYLLFLRIYFRRFLKLEQTSLFSCRFQIRDSNILNFINSIRILFSASLKWWLFIASKLLITKWKMQTTQSENRSVYHGKQNFRLCIVCCFPMWLEFLHNFALWQVFFLLSS